jgi:hypothetical protein
MLLAVGKKVRIVQIVDGAELGRSGGKARAANLSAEEVSEAGRKAVQARWAAYYRMHPEKLKAKLAKGTAEKKGRRK